jgi:6,7-dimethyl-8-ribityllumazine synthase
MQEIKGTYEGKGKKFAIVISAFNDMISRQLLTGCLETLKKAGVGDGDMTVYWTPGSFEIPLAAKKAAQTGRFNAVICLGAVIRGATPHFDYVCSAVTRGVGEVMLSSGLPVVFGVITADSQEQAVERAGIKQGNKGKDAALAALEMAGLMESI